MITSCSRGSSLRLQISLLAQGPFSASSTMRGLHSTASCTLRASGHSPLPSTRTRSPPPLRLGQSDDNSGEPALHHHRRHHNHQQRFCHIMAPPLRHRNSVSSPCSSCFAQTYSLPPPLCPMSPALTSVRAFSTMGVDYRPQPTGLPALKSTSTSTVNSATVASSKKFTYHASAAYSAKQKRFSPTTNIFHFNPYNRVHDTAKRKSRPDAGQDAFFVSRINDNGTVAAGVADGVGGYSDSGIDSADFSHTLCEHIASAAHSSPTDNINAKQLMTLGYQRILDEDLIPGGASTACVGVAKPDGQLNVANLGDSGFLIIRQGKVHHASSPQTHNFNTPYQLAMIPEELLAQFRQFGGNPLSDQPCDSHVSSHRLRNGDVVVFATDGVWDNLSTQEILRIVSDEMVLGSAWLIGEAGISPSPQLETLTLEGGIQAGVAKSLVARAKSASLNTKVDSPFAREAQRLFPGENFHGGKKDDICVVVMLVVEAENEQQFARGKL